MIISSYINVKDHTQSVVCELRTLSETNKNKQQKLMQCNPHQNSSSMLNNVVRLDIAIQNLLYNAIQMEQGVQRAKSVMDLSDPMLHIFLASF